jgi:hypothetical protein
VSTTTPPVSKRDAQRARYIDGWNTMDATKLLASITDDFIFDDPVDPSSITKATLVDYLPVWPNKTAALGAKFTFEIIDKSVQDHEGVLLEWYWWRLIGTTVEGSAVIKTSDEGVISERLTYYRTPWPLRR